MFMGLDHGFFCTLKRYNLAKLYLVHQDLKIVPSKIVPSAPRGWIWAPGALGAFDQGEDIQSIAFPERFWRCCKNKVLQPVNRVFSPKLRLVAFLFGCKIKIWKVAKLTNFLLQLKNTFDSITHLALSVPPKLLNKKRHKSTRFVEFQSSN